jgi:hypothetical protein
MGLNPDSSIILLIISTELIIYLSTYLSICLSVCLSIYLSLSVCLSIYLLIYLFIYLSIYLSVSVCLSIYLSLCLCLSLSLSVSVSLAIYLSIYLSSLHSISGWCKYFFSFPQGSDRLENPPTLPSSGYRRFIPPELSDYKVMLTTYLDLVPRLRISGATPPLAYMYAYTIIHGVVLK